MPVSVSKVPGKSCYRVSTPNGVKAKCASKTNAMKQKRLLNAVDHGFEPTNESVNDFVNEMLDEDCGDRLKHAREEFQKVDAEIDRIVKDGGRVGLADPLSIKLRKLSREIKQLKKKKTTEAIGRHKRGDRVRVKGGAQTDDFDAFILKVLPNRYEVVAVDDMEGATSIDELSSDAWTGFVDFNLNVLA